MSRHPGAAIALCIAAIAATTACTTTTMPTASIASTAPPKTALWVGNSFFYYSNSMHGHVGQLLAAAHPNERGYRSTSATISGSGLNWQDLEAHFKPGGVGSYSFVGNNEVVFNTCAYLAACTVPATVYSVSPVGNAYTAGLPPDVAAHLQATAWETVQSFRQPV